MKDEPEMDLDRLRQHTGSILGEFDWEKYAVLVPLLQEGTRNWTVLFEVRATQLDRQPGEVCFPGGSIEPQDPDLVTTAARETSEELGINPESIQLLGELDYLVLPWKMILYPFTAVLEPEEPLEPNPREVEEVFRVPVRRIMGAKPELHRVPLRPDPGEDFPYGKIPGGRNYPWKPGFQEEVFYEFDDRVIWGITARVLRNFARVLRGEAPG